MLNYLILAFINFRCRIKSLFFILATLTTILVLVIGFFLTLNVSENILNKSANSPFRENYWGGNTYFVEKEEGYSNRINGNLTDKEVIKYGEDVNQKLEKDKKFYSAVAYHEVDCSIDALKNLKYQSNISSSYSMYYPLSLCLADEKFINPLVDNNFSLEKMRKEGRNPIVLKWNNLLEFENKDSLSINLDTYERMEDLFKLKDKYLGAKLKFNRYVKQDYSEPINKEMPQVPLNVEFEIVGFSFNNVPGIGRNQMTAPKWVGEKKEVKELFEKGYEKQVFFEFKDFKARAEFQGSNTNSPIEATAAPITGRLNVTDYKSSLGATVDYIRSLLLPFVIAVYVIAMLILMINLNKIIAENYGQISLYRALGATRSHIFTIYSFFSLVIILTSILFSLLICSAISLFAMGIVRNNIVKIIFQFLDNLKFDLNILNNPLLSISYDKLLLLIVLVTIVSWLCTLPLIIKATLTKPIKYLREL